MQFQIQPAADGAYVGKSGKRVDVLPSTKGPQYKDIAAFATALGLVTPETYATQSTPPTGLPILTLTQVNLALVAAFQTALALLNPAAVISQWIGSNATLRTDVYAGPQGSGFVVVATVDLGWRKLTISKQHGPEVWREQPSPSLASLTAECQKERARRYDSEASIFDLADAETKMSSLDTQIQNAGAAQKVAVLAKRLAIKAAVPKPQ